MTSTTRLSRLTAAWTLLGLVLLTINLRAAITGVAPVLGDLRHSLGWPAGSAPNWRSPDRSS